MALAGVDPEPSHPERGVEELRCLARRPLAWRERSRPCSAAYWPMSACDAAATATSETVEEPGTSSSVKPFL